MIIIGGKRSGLINGEVGSIRRVCRTPRTSLIVSDQILLRILVEIQDRAVGDDQCAVIGAMHGSGCRGVVRLDLRVTQR